MDTENTSHHQRHSSTGTRTALICGATGLVGRGIAKALHEQGGWTILCASRSGAAGAEFGAGIDVDLLDAEDTRTRLARHPDITHVFYAAYAPRPSRREEVAPNTAMLRNVLDALQDRPALEHVVLVTGTKYYGSHLGAIRTPAVETDPRHMPPNFYFDQVDLLAARQKERRWTWTHLIPPFVSGFGVGHPMNIVTAISVYATISKEYGLPLRFPGSHSAYRSLFHYADASQIGAASRWAADSPAAANESFNVANGDPARWSNMWPAIAKALDMPLDDPKTLVLADHMPDKEEVWQRISARHGLRSNAYHGLVNWQWADYMLRIDYEVLLGMGKIRRAGFSAYPDTQALFVQRIHELREARIIP